MAWFKSKSIIKFNWLVINSQNSYNSAIQMSYIEPILIFKHSTRCSISSLALRKIESNTDEKCVNNCYYLDLLSYREISNKIADDLNVFHASPQILIIKNGKCVHHTSHNNISWRNIKI